MFNKIKKSIKENIEQSKVHYGIGLSQTFSNFSNQFNSLFIDRDFFDDEFFENFEEKLIELDIMPVLAVILRDKLEKKILNEKIDKDKFQKVIYEVISETVDLEKDNDLKLNPDELNVLLVIGVNGVGKTTTISKLIHKYKKDYNLELVAADTFRAGAIEQLTMWAERENVPITKTHEGHSPSAVVYEGIQSAVDNKRNLLICDTAGRLHNQEGLMEELKKIHRVISKYPEMNKDIEGKYNLKTILVLDGTAGKNTIEQAKTFNKITDIDGVIVTKLDTNSKAGMPINIEYELNKPIYFLTNGEAVENIVKFDAASYLELLLGE